MWLFSFVFLLKAYISSLKQRVQATWVGIISHTTYECAYASCRACSSHVAGTFPCNCVRERITDRGRICWRFNGIHETAMFPKALFCKLNSLNWPLLQPRPFVSWKSLNWTERIVCCKGCLCWHSLHSGRFIIGINTWGTSPDVKSYVATLCAAIRFSTSLSYQKP